MNEFLRERNSMALWPAFYGDNGDTEECYSAVYSSSYNYDYRPISIQEASHYSSTHESGESDLIEYKPCAYYRDDFSVTPLELNYPVYTYSEPEIVHYDPTEYPSYSYYESYLNTSETNYVQPKFLQYEPPPDDRGYFPVETHFTVSYSNHEFNAPEFEEYDPTPYGGGYDLVTTYGKPLPPSDNICYPRTHPHSGNNIAPPNFSYSSIPSPYGKEDHLPTKPPDVNVSTTHVGNGDKVSDDDGKEDKNVETDMIPTITDSPSSEHQEGLFDNGRRDVEREVTQFPPYGSGLEAMDLCESIFGYWPCLAKQQRNNECRVCDEIDPWEHAAVDYLFGAYDYDNHHHQNMPRYDYHVNSWRQ